MTSAAADTLVRIWTHAVPASEVARFAASLRDDELPRLARIDGHLASQLLLAQEPDRGIFTVISQWRAASATTMARIDGPLASLGTVTTQRAIEMRPVDVELTEMMVTHSVAPEPVGHRPGAAAIGALFVVAALAIAWLAGGDEGAPMADGPDSSSLLVTTSTPAPPRISDDIFVPWPDPPDDHDPHIIGRPGGGEPVRAALDGQALVYVNDRSRPTLIDLSTGDQRELNVAASRPVDQFLVEGGKIVVDDPLNPDLPLNSGRAFMFQVVLDGNASSTESVAAPTVCITADQGCTKRPWTTGQFGDGELRVQSFDGPPLVELASRLGAQSWTTNGRWTTFDFDPEQRVDSIRLPSPAAHAVVWLITEPS